MAMVHDHRPAGRHRSIVVGWHCALCIKNLGDSVLDNPRHPKVVFFQRESDFYDHFDRTCHICQEEFTCKVCTDYLVSRCRAFAYISIWENSLLL